MPFLQLEPCNATEYCKDITAKPGEYIVNPKAWNGNIVECQPLQFLLCVSISKDFATNDVYTESVSVRSGPGLPLHHRHGDQDHQDWQRLYHAQHQVPGPAQSR